MAGDDEKPSRNRERSCSNKRTSSDVSCCSNKRTRREIPSSPEQSSVSLNDLQPLLIEILHRLPSTQSAFLCKSVCKKWYSLISSPYFAGRFITHHLNHHYKQNPSAILISYWSKPSWNVLFTFSDEPMFRFDLSYLPERNGCVRVSAIVNDLMLCCVAKIEIGMLQYYICNPFTMQWVALPLLEADYMNDYKVGFVCEPYYFEDDQGECFINSKYRFRVVHFTRIESTQIVMKTYCSETRKWYRSVLEGSEFWWITDVVAHNGKLLWCNREHIFSYDPFNPELFTSINCSYMQTRLLPAVGKCFGVRQGFLCLMELIGVGINRTFHIWKLKDYNNGEWSLEDHVSLDAMIPESSLVQEIVDGSENKLKPLGFHPSDGNIVYLHFQTYVISFNTRTKELKMAGKIPVSALDLYARYASYWKRQKPLTLALSMNIKRKCNYPDASTGGCSISSLTAFFLIINFFSSVTSDELSAIQYTSYGGQRILVLGIFLRKHLAMVTSFSGNFAFSMIKSTSLIRVFTIAKAKGSSENI
ncbi:F-BOX PROTEIN INTERACTION DOMAIN PROTEIN-RELATED [Salix purpurea]|uniref:F-BOX PROTEIN INTERACTION DOMAIN PROTEIN-RELATED n=1 Tax=Salix purpurea TaxID=77065 RepID=A0A9Q0WP75_SALPP|nr:F-BOX PROTEIN INTERACTION DOMAIN PROTEIN-RELATED [Salix purpurea]